MSTLCTLWQGQRFYVYSSARSARLNHSNQYFSIINSISEFNQSLAKHTRVSSYRFETKQDFAKI